MIKVQGLSRRYGKHLALAGLSFEVGQGEVVGFLGPNGAGKSTTMKILTCSLAPTDGTATVAGHDILDEPIAVRRKVGFMPEHTALYPDMTVAALLEFVAVIKGVPGAERSAHLARIIQQTGLDRMVNKLVGNLSHGYRKRAGLAQALVGDPEVLILDEPTSGLDPHQIVEIRELIRSFRGRRTVLLSSHILSEVSATCERVLILDNGRLVGRESASGLVEAAGGQQAGPRVVLSWDGDRQGVAEALTQVTGVDDVVVTDEGAEVLIAGNPVEIRPKLVESVLAAGGRLQNIQDKPGTGPTLEDLFLRLTGAAPPQPSRPPEPADEDDPEAPS
jgi:ABC-2 type transport system ATP-binding protein